MRQIIYVEDDAVNALVMRKFLEKEFAFLHFFEGELAVDHLIHHPADLILMDINLGRGKKDGVETLREVRNRALTPHIPVVAITAYAMPEDEQRFISLGFTAYISKPVEREDLIKLIHQLLDAQ